MSDYLQLNLTQIRDLEYICEAAARELARRDELSWAHRAHAYQRLLRENADALLQARGSEEPPPPAYYPLFPPDLP